MPARRTTRLELAQEGVEIGAGDDVPPDGHGKRGAGNHTDRGGQGLPQAGIAPGEALDGGGGRSGEADVGPAGQRAQAGAGQRRQTWRQPGEGPRDRVVAVVRERLVVLHGEVFGR
jgi:hypothetical protein